MLRAQWSFPCLWINSRTDAQCPRISTLYTGIVRPRANHYGSQEGHVGTLGKIASLQGLHVKARLQSTVPSHSLTHQAGSHSQLIPL